MSRTKELSFYSVRLSCGHQWLEEENKLISWKPELFCKQDVCNICCPGPDITVDPLSFEIRKGEGVELNFSMVDVSLVVFEAPDQTGKMHLRAYASGLLHEKLKNIKASVRLRLAYWSAEVGMVPLQSHRSTSGFLDSSCTACSFQTVTFLAVLPLVIYENLSQVSLFLLGGFLTTVMLQPGSLCLCYLRNWEAPCSTAMPDTSFLA